jgi:stage II sporulation protein AA (anti-sigma F factor antagonist)
MIEDPTGAESPELLIVRVNRSDDVTTVALIGEIDMSNADTLREQLEPLNGDVVVDLAWLGFLDSSGIATLNEQRRRLEDGGGSFRMRRPTAHVREVLGIVGLDEWLAD